MSPDVESSGLVPYTTEDPPAGEPRPRARIDTNVPHAPRIWNHWLGGKDNFAADREVGDRPPLHM
jgi:hypothetical protein